jgi:hypothetical protein
VCQASEHRGKWRLDYSIMGPWLESVSAAVALLCALRVLWENTNTKKDSSLSPFQLARATVRDPKTGVLTVASYRVSKR